MNVRDFAGMPQYRRTPCYRTRHRCGIDPSHSLEADRILSLTEGSSSELRSQEALAAPVSARHVVVRCIIENEGKILLCQRADPPRRELWSTPGGYLERGESLSSAVIRETFEEVGVALDFVSPVCVHTLPQLNEIVVTFASSTREPAFAASAETLATRFFELQCLRWNSLAFPTDCDAIRLYGNQPQRLDGKVPSAVCFWAANGQIYAKSNGDIDYAQFCKATARAMERR